MSKTSSQVTTIGFFVLTALVLLIAMLIAFGGNSWLRSTVTYTMRFDSSVKGLSAGSPVMFRGVKIGQVTGIQLLALDSDATPDKPVDSFSFPVEVTAEIDPEKLGFDRTTWVDFFTGEVHAMREELRNYLTDMVVKQGLRAKLEMVSILTGQLSIEMTFDLVALENDDPDKIRAEMMKDFFPTRLGFLDKVSSRMGEKNFHNQMESMQKLVTQVTEFIDSGQSKQLLDDLSRIAANLRAITDNLNQQLPVLLGDSQGVLEHAQGVLLDVKEQVKPLAQNTLLLIARIGVALNSAHTLLNNLDNITELSKPKIEQLLTQFGTSLEEAQATLGDARNALQTAQAAIAPTSPTRQQLERMLDECEKSLNSLRLLIDQLQSNPQLLILGE